MKAINIKSIIFLTLLTVVAAHRINAQFYYEESCRNTTGIFQYYGHAPGYTAGLGVGDTNGNGWLRLTNCTTYQNGYVLLDKTFPSNMGVTIEFDFKIWASSYNPNHGIADGFSVFLFDGDPTKTFTIGVAGHGLGYVKMTPSYLGIGIDEYGNFSAKFSPDNPDGPGRRAHSISIRNATYNYVSGTANNLGINTNIGYTTLTNSRPSDATIYRRVRIDIEPITNGMSVPYI
jgi:hypothetical protein